MKLKSLLLGSVAAAGLSTTAFAADLSTVVSSFDVCEDLGISGTLQIASTDDCLQISGEVKYEFSWGDYAGSQPVAWASYDFATRNVDDNDAAGPDLNLDWKNDLDWWLMFVGSASSEFGTAKAVIKLADGGDEYGYNNEVTPINSPQEAINSVVLDEAYVSIGDGTTLVAGKRDTSVFKDDEDEPFGFIGLFNSDAVDTGVDVLGMTNGIDISLKGRVIQIYHAVGDSGVTLSAGLENLDGANVIPGPGAAGTVVGTIAYAAPDGMLSGHFSVAAAGILDGTIDDWKTHFGATATFDNFKVRGAFAYGVEDSGIFGTTTAWNGLVTAEATFDIFTIAAAAEFADTNGGFFASNPVWGASLTGSAAVTDQVTVEAGFRFYDSDTTFANDETWQAALRLIAKLTDTLTATGEVGYYAVGSAFGTPDTFYGKGELAWKPGGQFETSIAGEMNSLGAYKATFKASKKFD